MSPSEYFILIGNIYAAAALASHGVNEKITASILGTALILFGLYFKTQGQ